MTENTPQSAECLSHLTAELGKWHWDVTANKDVKTHCAICGGIAHKQQGSDENTEWLECENNGSHYAHFENYEWIDTESA